MNAVTVKGSYFITDYCLYGKRCKLGCQNYNKPPATFSTFINRIGLLAVQSRRDFFVILAYTVKYCLGNWGTSVPFTALIRRCVEMQCKNIFCGSSFLECNLVPRNNQWMLANVYVG